MPDYLYIEKENKLNVKENNLNCTINGFWKTLMMNDKCNGILIDYCIIQFYKKFKNALKNHMRNKMS